MILFRGVLALKIMGPQVTGGLVLGSPKECTKYTVKPFYFAGSNCWFLGWISKKPSNVFQIFGFLEGNFLSRPAGCEFSWVLMVGVLTGCTWNPKTTSLTHEWKRLNDHFVCKDLESSNWNNQVLYKWRFQVPGVGTWFRCSGQEGWRRLDVLQNLLRKWLEKPAYNPQTHMLEQNWTTYTKHWAKHGPSQNLTRLYRIIFSILANIFGM